MVSLPFLLCDGADHAFGFCWNLGIYSFAEAHFYISEPEILSATTYESVPISWGANPLSFSPVQGYLVLHNQTEDWLAKYAANFGDSYPNLILVCEYPGYTRPYVDDRIVMWQRRYRPAAAIFVGGSFVAAILRSPNFCAHSWSSFWSSESIQEGTYQQVGDLDLIKLGADTSEARYPIVQTHWRYWSELRPFLANNTLINASVTDQGTHPNSSLIPAIQGDPATHVNALLRSQRLEGGSTSLVSNMDQHLHALVHC